MRVLILFIKMQSYLKAYHLFPKGKVGKGKLLAWLIGYTDCKGKVRPNRQQALYAEVTM